MNTPPPLVESTGSTPKRILVIDDDEAVRTGLRCVLVTEGYEVLTAANGLEAEAACRQQACDLALLDMNMPLQNGWGTLAHLRKQDPTLPVVFITARPDQRTLARETGVELMEKPLDLPRLLQRIGELASQRGTVARGAS